MKIGDSPPINRGAAEGQLQKQSLSTEPQHSDTSKLSQGRLVKATVLSSLSDGQTLLSVAGKTLTAQSLVPLKAGQTLWFEVLQDGAQPLIALAGKKGAVVDLLRLLPSFSQAGQIADKLPQLLQALQPKLAAEIEQFFRLYSESAIGAEPDPAKILKNAMALGLFDKLQQGAGDNKLLKQQLLELFELQVQKSGAGVLNSAEEAKGLGRVLKFFEAFAQVNNQPLAPDQQNFLLFPCFFSGASGWGQWLFSFTQKEEQADSRQTYGLSFFLELSNLGELHLQVNLRGKALQGVFSVHDAAVSKHMAKNLGGLSRTLKNLGFHPVNLSCQMAQVANMQKLKEKLVELTEAEAFALVDLTI
jgi:hypothetical protein